MPRGPTLKYLNTASLMRPHVHGSHDKDLAVLHETVSPDAPGLSDILGVEHYLAGKDYGIHGMTDRDGNAAWAHGLGRAVFYQAGGVNERSVGIEQVSRVMIDAPTNTVRQHLWAARQKELRATAKLLACWHNTDPKRHPLRYSNSLAAGVTSHWDVSQYFRSSEGHTDCWPVHKGGYYPILAVINLARVYAKAGWHF